MHPVEHPLGAALEERDAQVRKFLEDAADREGDEAGRAVERASEHVHRVKIIVEVDQITLRVRMQHQRHVQALDCFIERIVRRIVDRALRRRRRDVRHAVHGLESKFDHTALELGDHALRIRPRQHRDRPQLSTRILRQAVRPGIVGVSDRRAQRTVVHAREHDQRREHELDVDAFTLVVAHAELHVHAALLAGRHLAALPLHVRVVHEVVPEALVDLIRIRPRDRVAELGLEAGLGVEADGPETGELPRQCKGFVHHVGLA